MFVVLLKYTAVAFIIMALVRSVVAQPFVVSGASMSPTFASGDYLVVNKLAYLAAMPQRGDIIVFRYPLDPSTYYIKRIAALPGETVELSSGVISVIGHDGIRHIFNGSHLAYDPDAQIPTVMTLASDEYFVLGDDRDASSDSRNWGPVRMNFIVGRVFVRVLPISNAGFMPGFEASSSVR